MFAYKTDAVISENGSLIIDGIPFKNGDEVEVVILKKSYTELQQRYPLRGSFYQFEDPHSSTAHAWDQPL